MVQISIGWVRQLQRSEADVVQGFVIDTECLISVLYKLMDRKGSVVWLHYSIGDLNVINFIAKKRQASTINLTLGDGTTENEAIILSGYSSRIFDMSKVPIPEPVPPPRECVSWKPLICSDRYL